jgi:hypothetical protein
MEEVITLPSIEVIQKLVLISDASEYDMDRVFEEQYWKAVEESGNRAPHVSSPRDAENYRATNREIISGRYR